MQLVDVGGGALELQLAGSAYGALFDSSAADGYGSDFAGSYDLSFTWRNVQQNAGGFDLVAELGIGAFAQGAGTGGVLGTTAGTAFMAGLDIYDWSGKYNWTLDALSTNTPHLSAWLTFGGGSHNGDFGFNMVSVPEPATLSLLGLGLLGMGAAVRRRRPR